MLFNSFIYFFFLITVLGFFYLVKNSGSRKAVLLIASYSFYAYWDYRFSALLVFVTISGFYISSAISLSRDRRSGKILYFLAIVANLTVLFFFRYFNFFADNINSVFSAFGTHNDLIHMRLIIPLGVSFYIFQSISYVTDVYKGRFIHEKSLTNYALYIAFFPKLIAGPIERAKDLMPQFIEVKKAKRVELEQGISLIAIGLFRKVLIGDTAGRFADHIFGNMEYYASSELIFALFMYSIQIYADFSGYTHIARGTGKLFGIDLVKNFEQPYLAKNMTDFWRRWHISLSSWLRDYLFLPLSYGISDKLKRERYFGIKSEYIIYIYATMITFTLCGLWHGASWNFVIWGFLHGVFLCLHRVLFAGKRSPAGRYMRKLPKKIRTVSGVVFTYLCVAFLWLFFRLPEMSSNKEFFTGLSNWIQSDHFGLFLSVSAVYMLVLLLADTLEIKTCSHDILSGIKNNSVRYGIISGLFFVIFLFMYQSDSSPFIYLQF